ncbi:MAG: hypothetical protein QXE01_05960 [Sulfolobales archaeon]
MEISIPIALSILILALSIPLSNIVYSLVIIIDSSGTSILSMPCSSLFSIEFNNSITGSPVKIVYRYCNGYIAGIAMYTDQAASEYYSAGLIDINRSLSRYSSDSVIFCSTQPLLITIQGWSRSFSGGCVVLASLVKILEIQGKKGISMFYLHI